MENFEPKKSEFLIAIADVLKEFNGSIVANFDKNGHPIIELFIDDDYVEMPHQRIHLTPNMLEPKQNEDLPF